MSDFSQLFAWFSRYKPLVDDAIEVAVERSFGAHSWEQSGFEQRRSERLLPHNEVSLESLPELDHYLFDPLRRFWSNPGKRVRPLLCCLGAFATGADPLVALPAAVAVERFQTAALIHDDIADEGMLRRGKLCLHRQEGVGLALNCGDFELCSVFGDLISLGLGAQKQKIAGAAAEAQGHSAALCSAAAADVRSATATDERSAVAHPAPEGSFTRPISPELSLALLQEFHHMMIKTLEGQALDLGFARDRSNGQVPQLEACLAMEQLKTAYYSAATPLAAGALLGGATNDQVEALRNFGLKIGLAFQIQDDLLNLQKAPAGALTTQKDRYSDLLEGKNTPLIAYAFAHADPSEQEILFSVWGRHPADALSDKANKSAETGDAAASKATGAKGTEATTISSSKAESGKKNQVDPLNFQAENIERCLKILETSGAYAWAHDYIQRSINGAVRDMSSLDISDEAKGLLSDVAHYFVERSS